MFNKKTAIFLLLIATILIVSGCAPAAQPAEEEAAPAEEEDAMGTYSVEFKNPDTITYLSIAEPESLDPAVTYESSGISTLRNIYDTLIFFKGSAVDEFVPMLAEEWTVSDDGLTYTFQIRDGVTFHEGGTLEPHDVAYTFQRNLLLGWDFLEMGGPMGLYFDPFFNGFADSSEYGLGMGGEEGYGLLAAEGIDGDDVAVCELIKDTITADDAAGTVTMHLAYDAGYFPQLLAQPWAGIQDMEWMVEQGAWDGDCATWRDYYAPDVSASTLYDKANGTGPYKLDHWTAGEELVLTANEDWWVDGPLWEGSTVDGVPAVKTVVTSVVEEWGTRLASVQAGDADLFDAEIAFASQTDDMVKEWTIYGGDTTEYNPNGILRLVQYLPRPQSDDMFMNFAIDTEGGNSWIGSGELNGAGIPADFFSDIHVRKAFNYCFDRDTFIQEVAQGEGIPHRGPIIADMLGYDPDSEIYDYDLAKCEEEFQAAWDGAVWENGFQMTLAYNSGNDSRRIANEILRDNISSLNEKFIIIIADLPWPTYLAERRAGRLPVHLTGWIEDFHHPHNWVLPYMSCHGDFSGAQHFPEEMCAPWDEMIGEAVRLSGPDPAAAEAIYKELQAASIENAIDIFIDQSTGRHYEQLWIQGYYYHPMFSDPYYAALSKVAP
jgi:peptide/nickel transport system substrate-binding protein